MTDKDNTNTSTRTTSTTTTMSDIAAMARRVAASVAARTERASVAATRPTITITVPFNRDRRGAAERRADLERDFRARFGGCDLRGDPRDGDTLTITIPEPTGQSEAKVRAHAASILAGKP